MKLLVLVVCLLIERFIEINVRQRFNWYVRYGNFIQQKLVASPLSSPIIIYLLIILPMTFLAWLLLHAFGCWIFGLVGFLLNILTVHYCLGPDNPFQFNEAKKDISISEYLIGVNGELFAVIFWYLLLGPIAVLIYRLVAIGNYTPSTREIASKAIALLDWLPARMTSLLYLLVGNFQAGKNKFFKLLFSGPSHNSELLESCGMKALKSNGIPVNLMQAKKLVEQATVAILVFIALFILLH